MKTTLCLELGAPAWPEAIADAEGDLVAPIRLQLADRARDLELFNLAVAIPPSASSPSPPATTTTLSVTNRVIADFCCSAP